MVGCDCAVCTSADPRDQRLRSSVLLTRGEAAIVIDTTPEFRLQMLRAKARRLDAVLLTHNHADHVHGLDDVRPYCFRQRMTIPVYGNEPTITWVRQHYAYVWQAPQEGGGLPKIDLHAVEGPFRTCDLTVTPLPVRHGVVLVYGYRIGDLAYIPDVSEIPDATRPLLAGVRTLILDAVRYAPHSTHFHVDRAVEEGRRVGAALTVLTHLNHDILHARLAAELPPGFAVAWDGMEIPVTA
jgi:phosphoribosyl 1,2-cyclic phosphate phosphodiesterase